MSATQDNMHRLEMACVGALMERTDIIDAFYQQLPLEQFGGGTGRIAKAVMDLIDANTEINPQSVVEQLRLNNDLTLAGGGTFVFDCLAAAHEWVDLHQAIETLGRYFGLRDAWGVGQRIAEATKTMDLGQWVAYADDQLDRIRKIEAGQMPPTLTYLRDVLTGEDVSVDWCVPGLLPSGTATMLTAAEGIGKSTILQQVALSAAAGLSVFEPWREGERYEPARVLLVDCENPQGKLTRNLRSLWSYANRFAPETDMMNMAVESQQGGLDMAGAQDQAWLHQLMRTYRPDLLVIGPVYRMAHVDNDKEEEVRRWQRTFEPLLADGVAILTEDHTPNEQGGRQRDLRPIGSSVKRRWFAQGVGIRPRRCKAHDDALCQRCRRRATVEAWRGSREEDARWPTHLQGAAEGRVWWERDQYAEEEILS